MENNFRLDYLPPDWMPYRTDISKMRDVWSELRLCDKSKYLLQKSGENDEFYKKRLKSAVFEDRTRRAIQEFAGVLALNYATQEKTPLEITSQFNNVDGAGSNFQVWLNHTLQKLLRDGCVGWFVGWDSISRQWRLIAVDPLSIKAPIVIDDKLVAFTVESIEQIIAGYSVSPVKVLYRHQIVENQGYTYYQYTKHLNADGEFVQVGEPVVPRDASNELLSEIPFIWLSLGASKIPLEFEFSFFSTLADLTIKQFNKISELDTAESDSNMATLAMYHAGPTPEPLPDIYIGSNSLIHIPDAQFGAKIEYLEPGGQAIQITHQRNLDREAYMDKLSKQFLSSDTVEKTATQIYAEISAVQAQLLNLIASIQDAIESTFKAIMLYASPLDLESTGGIIIDNEAIRPPIDVSTLRYWQELTDLGYLEKDKFLELLQIAGTFPRGFDVRI